jgi:hypothetical protein
MVVKGDAVAPSGRSGLGTASSNLSFAVFEDGTSLVSENYLQ